MTHSTNYYFDFPVNSNVNNSEFLDAEPLNVSEYDDADLDGFDFILEEDVALGVLSALGVADPKESSGYCTMATTESDCRSVMRESSFNSMVPIDVVKENEAHLSSYEADDYCPRRSQRDRLPSLQAQHCNQQRLEASAVNNNFDPPVGEIFFQDHRQTSPSSACQLTGDHHPYPSDNDQYNEALQLQNLAESMKRTEESRRVVMMMQRKMLTLEQQRALSSAKERVQRQNQQVVQSSSAMVMDTFFSGSSSGASLTSGLEQGRKQLGMYMSQVNHRVLSQRRY